MFQPRFVPIIVHTIRTHVQPHLDEYMALWLLRKFGSRHFPGVSKAPISYEGTPEEGITADQLEANGILCLGIQGGRFDEHATAENGQKGKSGESCSSLVAKHLGVDDDPGLYQILKDIRIDDNQGGKHALYLGNLLKRMHAAYPENPEVVMIWINMALDALWENQSEFAEAKVEFEKFSSMWQVPTIHGEQTLVCVRSNNPQVAKYARSRMGAGAAVVIQVRSSGNVQIFPNQGLGFAEAEMSHVVAALRTVEHRLNGGDGKLDKRSSHAAGTMPEVPNWYLQDNAGVILNGSLTRPEIKATSIPIGDTKAEIDLVNIVIDALRLPVDLAESGVYDYQPKTAADAVALARDIGPNLALADLGDKMKVAA